MFDVLLDGDVMWENAPTATAAGDYARGARQSLRAAGAPYVGRVVVRAKKPGTERQPNLSTVIDSTKFVMVGSEKQGGGVLREIFFHTDRTNVMVTVDYTYTKDGHK